MPEATDLVAGGVGHPPRNLPCVDGLMTHKGYDEIVDETGMTGSASQEVQREIKQLRQVIEELPEVLISHKNIATTPALIEIVMALKVAGEYLHKIQEHPVLKLTPSQHATELAHAGEHMMRSASRDLKLAAAESWRLNENLGALVGAARARDRQRRRLLWTGVAGLSFGLVISPLFARLLPLELDKRIATFILRTDWESQSSADAVSKVSSQAKSSGR